MKAECENERVTASHPGPETIKAPLVVSSRPKTDRHRKTVYHKSQGCGTVVMNELERIGTEELRMIFGGNVAPLV